MAKLPKERSARDAQAQKRNSEIRKIRQTVKSRKQAIAIGLSEAREKGAKVPRQKNKK